jgi:hypothetical protein
MFDQTYTSRGKKMSVAAFPVIFQRIYFQPKQRNVADPMHALTGRPWRQSELNDEIVKEQNAQALHIMW